MHVFAAVLITSLNSRNIMLENGGYVVLNLLVVWSMFLPLDRRFSVDAFLRSWRARREGTSAALEDRSLPERDTRPVVSLAVAALILQWAVIYYFNVVHKNGPLWRDGTAVYYFFQQDRMVTVLGAWLRYVMPFWIITFMTFGTLVIESTLVVLLLSPVAPGISRMIAWILVCTLHLTIDAVVQLGPFSYAMATMFFLLIPARFWELFASRRRAIKPKRKLYFDPDDGFCLSLCRFVKRLDGLALVEFVPLKGSPDEAAGPDAPAAEKLGRETLTVGDETGRLWTGAEALYRLAQALPLVRFPLLVVRVIGIRTLVDRALARLAQRRARVSQFFALDALPRSDLRAPEPTPARRELASVSALAQTACVAVLIIATGSQVLVENRAVPEWLKPKRRPEWMEAIVIYPRLFQGWSMFAPGPPLDDGRLVVEGRTKDGRHLDPLTGQKPTFEVQPRDGFRMNQIWGDFHRRIGEPRFSVYLGGVRDFLLNHHEITGRPEDQLVAFEVWYVTEVIPPPGTPEPPPQKRLLLRHGTLR
jgi:predicted DCC family thiol-disulfide oxidoreductase YuxK